MEVNISSSVGEDLLYKKVLNEDESDLLEQSVGRSLLENGLSLALEEDESYLLELNGQRPVKGQKVSGNRKKLDPKQVPNDNIDAGELSVKRKLIFGLNMTSEMANIRASPSAIQMKRKKECEATILSSTHKRRFTVSGEDCLTPPPSALQRLMLSRGRSTSTPPPKKRGHRRAVKTTTPLRTCSKQRNIVEMLCLPEREDTSKAACLTGKDEEVSNKDLRKPDEETN